MTNKDYKELVAAILNNSMTVTMITCSLTGGSLLFSLLFFSQLDLFGNSFLFLFYQFFSYSLFSQAPLFIMYLFFPLFNFFNKSCIFFCLAIFFFLSPLFTQLVPNVSGYLSIEKKKNCVKHQCNLHYMAM